MLMAAAALTMMTAAAPAMADPGHRGHGYYGHGHDYRHWKHERREARRDRREDRRIARHAYRDGYRDARRAGRYYYRGRYYDYPPVSYRNVPAPRGWYGYNVHYSAHRKSVV